MDENEKNFFEKNFETGKENINIESSKTSAENRRNKLKRKFKISSAKLPFSKTSQEFQTEKINLKDFTGFFNRKFNLDLYKKLCEDTRKNLK